MKMPRPHSRVRGRVFRPQVSFHFNDASGERQASHLADHQFAQQRARDQPRIAVEELPSQQRGFARHTGRDCT